MSHAGAVNSGISTSYQIDNAQNRTQVTKTGAANSGFHNHRDACKIGPAAIGYVDNTIAIVFDFDVSYCTKCV